MDRLNLLQVNMPEILINMILLITPLNLEIKRPEHGIQQSIITTQWSVD